MCWLSLPIAHLRTLASLLLHTLHHRCDPRIISGCTARILLVTEGGARHILYLLDDMQRRSAVQQRRDLHLIAHCCSAQRALHLPLGERDMDAAAAKAVAASTGPESGGNFGGEADGAAVQAFYVRPWAAHVKQAQ